MAPPAGMGPKSLSALAFLALVAVLVLLFVEHALLAVEPVGATVQGLAVALMIWARITFGVRSFHATADPTSGGIVTYGPYRWIRHPVYAAILYFVAVSVLSHPSGQVLGLGVFAVGSCVVRMLAEERLLLKRYPEYAEYAARTKRVIPGLI